MKKTTQNRRYNIRKTFEYNKANGPFEKATNKKSAIKKALGTYGITTDFFGFKTKLPIGVAAGTLHNMDYLEAAMKDGFTVLTWKTFRSEERIAHRNNGDYLGHNIVFLPTAPIAQKDIGTHRIGSLTLADAPEQVSITNSVGMPSPAPFEWFPLIAQGQKVAKKYDTLVITSVVGTAHAGDDIYALARDYAFTARMAESAGERIIELNLSCPNVSGKEGVIYKDIRSATIISKTVREMLRSADTKVLLKLGYASKAHYKKLLSACAAYIDGVVAINTIPMEVVDRYGQQALPGGLSSGTCGAAIIDRSVEAVAWLAEAKKALGKKAAHIKIVGCGGVTDAESFMRHIDAGAEFVMCATASLFNTDLPLQIAQYLRDAKIKR